MNIVDNKLYDAVVVESPIHDPNRSGSVRAKIFGWTDDLPDDKQPWISPMVNSVAKVPTVGTYLKIYFNGDLSFPIYIGQGIADGNYLPSEYIDGYPNIIVSDSGIRGNYDSLTNEYSEYDAVTGYERNVLQNGTTVITCPSGYSYDVDNNRSSNSRIMVEDVVNICTGRPFNQGSHLYRIPTHVDEEIIISQGTIDQEG